MPGHISVMLDCPALLVVMFARPDGMYAPHLTYILATVANGQPL